MWENCSDDSMVVVGIFEAGTTENLLILEEVKLSVAIADGIKARIEMIKIRQILHLNLLVINNFSTPHRKKQC